MSDEDDDDMLKRIHEFDNVVKTVNVVDISDKFKESTTSDLLEATASFQPGTIELIYESKPDFTCSWLNAEEEVTENNLLKALEVDEARRKYIWSIDQKEDDWHKERRGRLTGSRIGSAIGNNPYQTPEKLIHEWLYVPVLDNVNMKWGRDHEDEARQFYKLLRESHHHNQKKIIPFDPPPSYLPEEFRTIDHPDYITPVDPNAISDKPYHIEITVRGLIVHPVHNWMAYSPDGEVEETDDSGLLEIKCPRRMYKEIPWYYYDQIQFGMFQLKKKWCDFFVWTKSQQTLHRYQFNPKYWENFMLPRMTSFYFEKFLPAAVIAIQKERNPEIVEQHFTRRLHL
jgi:hypothetical protein